MGQSSANTASLDSVTVKLEVSIVIATRNRPQPLEETLRSLLCQSYWPTEVIVVDSSEDHLSKEIVQRFAAQVSYSVSFQRAEVPSAARQRNLGISISSGDIVVFVDDDVTLDELFLKELIKPFEDDATGMIGGVSATITNQQFQEPSSLGRFVLGCFLGDWRSPLGGRVVGPAVNFYPSPKPERTHRVEWLNSGGTAYRRSLLLQYQFGNSFLGYSFAEDLHLSTRIAKHAILLHSTAARYVHYDLGMHTHKDWYAIGTSAVLNRYLIMTSILGKQSYLDYCQLFAYEIVYCGMTAISANMRNPARMLNLFKQLIGKVMGFAILLRRKSVHEQYSQSSDR